jgi:hypothetical protein
MIWFVHFGQRLHTREPLLRALIPGVQTAKPFVPCPVYFWTVYSLVLGTCQFGKLAYFFLESQKISLGRKKLRFAVDLASFFGPSFGLVTGLHEALQKEALP